MTLQVGQRETPVTSSREGHHVIVFGDRETLMEAAAERIVEIAGQAIANRGRFSWVLSGGTTPIQLYRLLASDRFAKVIDWGHVHFFWGDERCVPPDSADSNYRVAKETLLDAVNPPEENVHRMRGEEEPSRAAASYEQLLHEFLDAPTGPSSPRFDLVLLGMGADGHTASLFPGTAPVFERTRWVMPNQVPQNATWRLTLTPVIINAAAQVVFLVVGAGKAERLAEVLRAGPANTEVPPARLIHASQGDVLWLVDADAAAHIERRSS